MLGTVNNYGEVMQSRGKGCSVAVFTNSRFNARKEITSMKKIFAVTLVAALALFAGSAYANFCARDVVPASTLLVPYVVVGMSGNVPNATGYTTALSVTNTSWEATIIHVVVWSAVSDGILDFDEVLSGYDVWTINFRDLLSGNWSAFDTSLSASAAPNKDLLPLIRKTFEWGPDGRSAFSVPGAPYYVPYPTGLPNPQGTQDLSAAAKANCKMPFTNATGAQYAPMVVSALQAPIYARAHLGCDTQVVTRHANDWLTGLSTPADPLFFYVTVDNFKRCELTFPEDLGYFGSRGNYNYENVLIGEIYYMNSTLNYSEATPAVHIESDLDSALADTASEFYSPKYSDPATFLEPLGTAFGFKYYNGAITSSAIVWKNYWEFDDLETWDDDVLDCGAYLYYAWDEDEHVTTRGVTCPVSPCQGADIDPNEFPFETQMVPLSTANFDLPAAAGWMLLVFPPSYDAGFTVNNGDPTPYPDLILRDYQAWVATRIEWGSYSMGLEAATMANAHCFPDQILPNLGISYPQWGAVGNDDWMNEAAK